MRSGNADNNVAAGLIGFGILPLFPAALMWLAHSLNMRRLRRQNAGGNATGTGTEV
jgi:hypothetical protein